MDKNFSNEEKEIIDAFIEFIKSPKNSLYNLDFFRKCYRKVKFQAKIKRETLDSFEPEELMFLPVVNSPRMGVCGYTGND